MSQDITMWGKTITFTKDFGSWHSVLDKQQLKLACEARMESGECISSFLARQSVQPNAIHEVPIPAHGITLYNLATEQWVALPVWKCLAIPVVIDRVPSRLKFLIVEDNITWAVLGADNIRNVDTGALPA